MDMSIETLEQTIARLDRAGVVSDRLDRLDFGNDAEANGFLIGYLTSVVPDAVAEALDALEKHRAEKAAT